MTKKMELEMRAAQALPVGAGMSGSWMRFSIALEDGDMPVVLKIMDKETREVLCQTDMADYPAGGRIYAVEIKGLRAESICYQYVGKSGAMKDPYAVKMADDCTWGIYKSREERFIYQPYSFRFDWKDDKAPGIAYENMVMYKLHVRGFTKHPSSGVRKKGTFLGLAAKIPYLKELGINCVELMPVVDFEEVAVRGMNPTKLPPTITKDMLESRNSEEMHMLASMTGQKQLQTFVNYWGYGDAQYFAPKAAYGSGDVQKEFCTMVQEFHKNGMEVILEMLFVNGTTPTEILDCLRHWVMNYHVDGFHLNSEIVTMDMVVHDPLLSTVKLICGGFDTGRIYGEKIPANRRLASAGDDFQNTMRCFLKGDEDVVRSFVWHNTHNDARQASIHYMTGNNGFTLADLMAYDKKHNEDNGEDNRDGNEYNHSWNCGEEGPTKRRKVRALRQRQMRNAMVMTVFSQGVPMIYAGDEFGNSQQGNNNAYCQDNEISWLNWKDLRKNRSHYEFTKMLLRLRNDHPILHPKKAFRMMDYLSCGMPDLSLHGEKPWYPDYSPESRYIGVMYCEAYARLDGHEDASFYFAYNMHWDKAEAALPVLPRGQCWKVCVDTAQPVDVEKAKARENTAGEDGQRKPPHRMDAHGSITVEPRSIVILMSSPAAECGKAAEYEKYDGSSEDCSKRGGTIAKTEGAKHE